MVSQTTRFREEEWVEWQGSASSTPPPSATIYASGSQDLIISENHAPLRLGINDDGGPFHCVKRVLNEKNFGPTHNRTVVSSSDSNSFAYNYKGLYHAKHDVVTNSSFPNPPIADSFELAALGTIAIARCAPTNPLVDIAVTVGEIRREGLPNLAGASLLRERALRARNAGGEYLNAEFGWRPLVNDVLSLSDAVIDSDDVITNYVRNQGKLVRRRYTFPDQYSTSTSTSSAGTDARPVPAIKTGYWNATGELTTTTYNRKSIWFSGAFTYWLPPYRTVAREEAILAKKYGIRITPEVLWNLAPWSWAADWFTNTGDFLHNVSVFQNDGLVMPWAYIMCRHDYTTRYSHAGSRTKRYNQSVDVYQKLRTIRKQRKAASPYGFGLDPLTFSNRQWAILAALGLSQGHGQL